VKCSYIAPNPAFYMMDEDPEPEIDCRQFFFPEAEPPSTSHKPTITLDFSAPGLLDILPVYKITQQIVSLANYKLRTSDQVPKAEVRGSNTVYLNSYLPEHLAFIYAARAIRQHRRPSLKWNDYHPDSAVLLNRLLAADLDVFTVKCCWEAKLLGFSAPWEFLQTNWLSYIAKCYERTAQDFRTLRTGEAMTEALESWFLSDLPKKVDKITVATMLANYTGYINRTDEMRIGPIEVGMIGEVPGGANYLAKHASTILSDRTFTGVRDRSNANFLWFIKFEKSFREEGGSARLQPIT